MDSVSAAQDAMSARCERPPSGAPAPADKRQMQYNSFANTMHWRC